MSFLDSRQQVAPRGIGKPVLRREDARFVTGTGRYADDVNLPGQTYAYVVRSPHAHARIARIDVGPPAAAGNQWLEPRRKCLMESSSSGPFHCSSQERSSASAAENPVGHLCRSPWEPHLRIAIIEQLVN